MHHWDQIWNERGEQYPDDDVIKLSGWDQAFSSVNEDIVNRIVEHISSKLKLSSGDSMLELGCGSCMLLSKLAPVVRECHGTDLSEKMIERARELFPELKIQSADSTNLPFSSGKFNKLFIHGVVQYFPNYNYAENVLTELVRVAKQTAIILISDVMDADKKEEYLRLRNHSPAETIWKSSVEHTDHLYYPKDFYVQFALRNNLSCTITQRDIPGYLNSPYRYDVLLERRS